MTSQILTIDRLKLSTLFLTSMLVPADRYWEIDMCDFQLLWGLEHIRISNVTFDLDAFIWHS